MDTKADLSRSGILPTCAMDDVTDAIHDIAQRGMRCILEVLLHEEAEAYVTRHHHLRDAGGRALVSRNGVARARVVPVGSVSVMIRAPRVNDRRVVDGARQRFASAILPPGRPPALGGTYRITALFLSGWASGDFAPVAAHLAAAEVPHGERVLAPLAELRDDYVAEPLADARFERLTAGVAHLAPPFGAARQLLALVGTLPSGRQRVIEVRVGDPDEPTVWRTLVERARARGLQHAGIDEIHGAALGRAALVQGAA